MTKFDTQDEARDALITSGYQWDGRAWAKDAVRVKISRDSGDRKYFITKLI